jgi:hypothetical protein
MNIKYFNLESFLILVSCAFISYLYACAGYAQSGTFSFNFANSFSFAAFIFFLNAFAAALINYVKNKARRESGITAALFAAGAFFGAVLVINSGIGVFFCEIALIYVYVKCGGQKLPSRFSAVKTFYRFAVIFLVFFTAFYINNYASELIYISNFAGVVTIVLHTREILGIIILSAPVFLFYAAFYLARDMALEKGALRPAAGKRRILALILVLYAAAYLFLILPVILKYAGTLYLLALLSAPRVYSKYKKFAASNYSESRLVFLNILTLNNFCLPAMAMALFFNR